MEIKPWEALPLYMQNEEVRPYYEILKTKEKQLQKKRIFDVVMASIILTMALPLLIIIAICKMKGIF